jgi:hypothetical protein
VNAARRKTIAIIAAELKEQSATFVQALDKVDICSISRFNALDHLGRDIEVEPLPDVRGLAANVAEWAALLSELLKVDAPKP